MNIGMKQTAPGTFLGTIPANYLAAKGSIRYYIEAANEGGDWAETPWYVISVQDPGESTPAAPGEEGDSEKPAWVWPTVLIGGGALAVAGAVALADSGGGGGGGDDTDKGGSGDGNISDRLLVRTATGQARTNIAHLPDDTTVDASATLGTRKIVNIRVDFTYDPADQGEEEFQVLYKGNPVISTGYTTTAGSRTVTLAGEDAAVTFRVLSSTPGDDNFYTWNWSGTVTYILDSGGSK